MATPPLRLERWQVENPLAAAICTFAAYFIAIASTRDGKCPAGMLAVSATVARRSRGPACSTWFPEEESRFEVQRTKRARQSSSTSLSIPSSFTCDGFTRSCMSIRNLKPSQKRGRANSFLRIPLTPPELVSTTTRVLHILWIDLIEFLPE